MSSIILKDYRNQRSLICGITGISDPEKALEHFLTQCSLRLVQDQRALDGLIRLGVLNGVIDPNDDPEKYFD